MRKWKNRAAYDLPLHYVVLIELPWGFAFFDVANHIFHKPVNMIWAHFTNKEAVDKVVEFLDLVKVDDKSAVWDRPDEIDDESDDDESDDDKSFAELVKEFSSRAERFIVEDEKICRLIKSNPEIDCFTAKENVVHEVAWGLRNALPFLCEFTYDFNISEQCPCPLPLCQGFKALMKKYEIVIPTEAVDREFLKYAGTLQRFEELRVCYGTEMRKQCDKLVPGISGMIKDNSRYVEVMAKILTPWLVGEWDTSRWSTAAGEQWFTPDEMLKIVAKDAAAGDAREKVKVDNELAAMIKDKLNSYMQFAESEDFFVEKLRLYEAKAKIGQKKRQKRSHKEMAEQEVGGS